MMMMVINLKGELAPKMVTIQPKMMQNQLAHQWPLQVGGFLTIRKIMGGSQKVVGLCMTAIGLRTYSSAKRDSVIRRILLTDSGISYVGQFTYPNANAPMKPCKAQKDPVKDLKSK